ncbi:hypothetical protein WJX77_005688 [Trebouxia sp. C0004]
MQPCYKEVLSSAQLPPVMENSFVGCFGSLFSKDSNAMPKLLNSAPRPFSPSFRAYSSPLAASDVVLGPHFNSLATPAWRQKTPSIILSNLHRHQLTLWYPRHSPFQRFLQAPLPALLQAPLPAPSLPPFQVPVQLPCQEPFLDVLQLQDWHALESALSLQT